MKYTLQQYSCSITLPQGNVRTNPCPTGLRMPSLMTSPASRTSRLRPDRAGVATAEQHRASTTKMCNRSLATRSHAPHDDYRSSPLNISGAIPSVHFSNLMDEPSESNPATATITHAFSREGLGAHLVTGFPEEMHLPELTCKVQRILPFSNEGEFSVASDPQSQHANGYHVFAPKEQDWETPLESFYFNPITDSPKVSFPELYPEFSSPNKWIPTIPELEVGGKLLGSSAVTWSIRTLLHLEYGMLGKKAAARKIIPTLMRNSQCHKGRLINYRAARQAAAESPTDSQQQQDEDKQAQLRGEHTDLACVTVLTRATYYQGLKQVPAPDDEVGLYIKTRSGLWIKVDIPEGCVLILMGDAMQALTGGRIQCTPHRVDGLKGPAKYTTSRQVFVAFVQPDVGVVMEDVWGDAAGPAPAAAELANPTKPVATFGDWVDKSHKKAEESQKVI